MTWMKIEIAEVSGNETVRVEPLVRVDIGTVAVLLTVDETVRLHNVLGAYLAEKTEAYDQRGMK